MATGSRNRIDGRRRLSQAASAAWSLLYRLTGNGSAASGMQLQLNHKDDNGHAGGNLYGDRKRNLRDGDQNHDGSVYGAVGVVSDSEELKRGTTALLSVPVSRSTHFDIFKTAVLRSSDAIIL
jgi:hypothetical protein